jgi:hypothetical protein
MTPRESEANSSAEDRRHRRDQPPDMAHRSCPSGGLPCPGRSGASSVLFARSHRCQIHRVRSRPAEQACPRRRAYPANQTAPEKALRPLVPRDGRGCQENGVTGSCWGLVHTDLKNMRIRAGSTHSKAWNWRTRALPACYITATSWSPRASRSACAKPETEEVHAPGRPEQPRGVGLSLGHQRGPPQLGR